jgi:hypothetical protein
MAQLNAAEPHLRDLEITVDGLNVVDIQFAGPGVWVPRFKVQISGDRGLDDTTGQRSVYLQAAEYLRAALLNNGTGDGTTRHAFVPHANISREDEPGDQEAAVALANRAITRLLDAYKGIDPENDGKPVVDDHFEFYNKALHIVVRTVDFDLTEKRVLSGEAFEHLQSLIDAPADPSTKLVKLMSSQLTPRGVAGDVDQKFFDKPTMPFIEGLAVNNTTVVENGGEPLAEDEPELALSNVTKSFDGVLHVSVVLEGSLVAPNQVYWIPADRANDFPSLDAIRRGTVLTCIAAGDDWIEYLVQIPDVENAVPEIKPDVRATTTLIDGVPHKRNERTDNGTVNVFWIPETMDVVIDQDNDIPDDLIMQIIAEDDHGGLVWQVIGRK